MSETMQLWSTLERAVESRAAALATGGFTVSCVVACSPPAQRIEPCLAAAVTLLDACLGRGEFSGRGGPLELGAGITGRGAPTLRCWLSDELPGIAAAQSAFFAALADVEDRGGDSLSRLLLGPRALRRPELQSYDLISGPDGNLVWFDMSPAGSELVKAKGESAPPGWQRLDVHEPTGLLRRVDGDEDIAAIVRDSFSEDVPRLLAGIDAALEGADAPSTRRLCHSLKGAALNVGAPQLSDVAYAGEREAQAGRLHRVAAIRPRLEWEFERLVPHLHLP